MSQHIANMERELGFRLFRRNNRNVELTPAGRDFYEQMKLVVHSYDSAVRHSQNLSSGGEGSITVAVPSCIEGLAFMSRLRRGECDIAICWPYDMMEADEISVQNLGEFKSLLVCAKDHPLAAYKSVTPEKLRDEQFAIVDLRGMPATQRTMYKNWKDLGLIPPTEPSFDHVDRVEELLFTVGMNNAVAMLPEYVRNNITGRIAFLEVDTPAPLMFRTGAGYLTNSSNPALHTALDVLRDSRIPMDY